MRMLEVTQTATAYRLVCKSSSGADKLKGKAVVKQKTLLSLERTPGDRQQRGVRGIKSCLITLIGLQASHVSL